MKADELLEALWASYVAIAPQALAIREFLRGRGDDIVNDHIALRTYGRTLVALDRMAVPFTDRGWEPRDDYVFPNKHLSARYFAHPDPRQPKVFISQLEVDAMPPVVATIIDELVATLPSDFGTGAGWIASGRPWPLTHEQYQILAAESEYAAWVAAHGFRANHFTVDVSSLSSVSGLGELCDALSGAGFRLNESGGVIKGGEDVFLAQASTMAESRPVELDDGTFEIPTCYVEFAQRFPQPDGTVYQGFIASSADRIFESTDRR